jgi:hypothetical protein
MDADVNREALEVLAAFGRRPFGSGQFQRRARAGNRCPAIFCQARSFLIFASEVADCVAASLSRHQTKLISPDFSHG